MEPSLTQFDQKTAAEASANVKQEFLLFLDKFEVYRHNENTFQSYGLPPVISAEECVFYIEPATVILLPNKTYKEAIEFCIISQPRQQHKCPLDTDAGLDVIKKTSPSENGYQHQARAVATLAHSD